VTYDKSIFGKAIGKIREKVIRKIHESALREIREKVIREIHENAIHDFDRKAAIQEYVAIMKPYMEGHVPAFEFTRPYMNKMKSDNRMFGGELYKTMQTVFEACDCYSEDPELLAQKPYYIDETELRAEVAAGLEKLNKLISSL
jgi:hypothetical protein